MSGPRPAHSFVVPAYGRSPYLGACLRSLAEQSVPSPVVVSTSTPYDGLDELCEQHGARLVVHGPNQGIGHDWNMALRAAETDWVTLAHQDDLYAAGYSAFVARVAADHPDDLLAFSTYDEVEGDRKRDTVPMLRVKRVMLELAFLGRGRITSRRSKRRALRLGNPIGCPAVAINRAAAPDFAFRTDMKTNMDWMAWLDLAERPGGFSLDRRPLMTHRIHAASETSATIDAGDRRREDRTVFERLWPSPIAGGLTALYGVSYRSNAVRESDGGGS
jgi:glycosyltransferase involved in cell wall biosynthesis